MIWVVSASSGHAAVLVVSAVRNNLREHGFLERANEGFGDSFRDEQSAAVAAIRRRSLLLPKASKATALPLHRPALLDNPARDVVELHLKRGAAGFCNPRGEPVLLPSRKIASSNWELQCAQPCCCTGLVGRVAG